MKKAESMRTSEILDELATDLADDRFDELDKELDKRIPFGYLEERIQEYIDKLEKLEEKFRLHKHSGDDVVMKI